MRAIRACRVPFLPALFFTFTICLPTLSHATMIKRRNHAFAPSRKHRRTIPDRRFRDVPRSHPAYKIYDRLVKVGIASYPDCIGYVRPLHWPPSLTRYEFAVTVQRAQAGLSHPNAALQSKITSQEGVSLRRDVARLAAMFRPELRELSR